MEMMTWRAVSKSCAKAFLIALNLVCIMNATGTFAFAIVDTRILQQYGEEHATGSVRGNIAVTAASGVVLCVATFGIAAALKENVRMLNLYVTQVLGLMLMELVITIFVSVQRFGLKFKIAELLRTDFFSNVTESGRLEHERMWDRLQTTYGCCGLNSPQDYAAIGQPISLSCCDWAYRARTQSAQTNMYRTCIESATYYPDGCEDVILGILKSDSDWLFGVTVVSFWMESMSMLMAMCLVNHVMNSVTVYKNTVKY